MADHDTATQVTAPRRGLVRSASVTLGTRLLAFGFSAATNIILARSLGPQGRGVYAVAVMTSAIISLLAQFGLGPANVYHLSKQLFDLEELTGHATSLALLLGTFCFLIVLACVWFTSSTTVLGIDARFVVVATAAVPFMLLTAFMQSLLQGGQRFVHFNAVILVQYGAPTFTLITFLLIVHDRTLGAVISWTVSSAVTAICATYLVLPLSRLSVRFRPSTLRPLLRFGVISYLSNVTSFVNYRFDVLIVNLFAGARQVGLYAVGTSLAEVVWFITNAASVVLAPRVAASGADAADRVTESVARVVALITLAAAVGLALVAPFAVVLFFGPAYADSTWAVWLLLPGIETFSVGRVLSMYLLGRNRLKIDLLAASVGLVVTLVLDFTLIPVFGFRGAAVASSVAYTAAMLVSMTWVVRHSTITMNRLLIARPADVRLLWTRVRGFFGSAG